MCGCGVVMMVAAPPDQNPITCTSSSSSSRPPLLPSEKDNGFIPPNKRPKSKQVSSRYMSPSPSPSPSPSSSSLSRRPPSPLVSRNSTPSPNNARSLSVDRRRPLPSRTDLNPKLNKKGTEMSAAAKLLVTSTRSLSVSFQGESYSLPVKKTKATPRPQSPNLGSVRKGTTPERKRSNTPTVRGKVDSNGDHFENSKHMDQHRWPATVRQSSNALSRSLNYSADDKKRLVGSDKVIRALQQSMNADEGRRASFDGRLSLDFANTEMLKAKDKKQSSMEKEGQRASFDSNLSLNLGKTEITKAREKNQTMMGDEAQRASFDGRLGLNLGSHDLSQAREKKQSLKCDEAQGASFDCRLSPDLGNTELLKAREKTLSVIGDEDQRASFDGRLSLNLGKTKIIKLREQSLIANEGRRASFDGRFDLNFGNAELMKARELGPTRCSVNESDSDSVSSGSNSGIQDLGSVKPRVFSVSARFWQETNSRLRRLHDPGSPLSNSPSKLTVPPKFGQSKKYPNDTISSPRAVSSPIRSGVRPASPSKLMPSMISSPSRGNISPSRVRNFISGLNEIPSVLSYAVDVRRGKVGENQLVDAHSLRILYNRHLQWRFVNARAESAFLVQKRSAEKNLWNAWITISGLRDSVTKRHHRLQLLKQKLKLSSILKGQITFLEGWTSFEKDHFVSLLGAIEALRASTLRLPVVGGATADVQNVKDAIGSAVDMMQAMASSLYILSSKADETNSLVVELAKVTAKESDLLEKCKGFFSMLASMQVKDCSLRTHLLQHNRVT